MSKLGPLTERVGPRHKGRYPLFFVFIAVIAPVPKKCQLVVAKLEPVHARQDIIKRVQRSQAFWKVTGNSFAEGIIQPQRIMLPLVGGYGLVDQDGEETVAYPKLGSFEEVVFVVRKEFPYHAAEGFTKIGKNALRNSGLQATLDDLCDLHKRLLVDGIEIIQPMAIHIQHHDHFSLPHDRQHNL